MPLTPKPLATAAKVSFSAKAPQMPKLQGLGAGALKGIKPTVPKVTVSSPYLRAGLAGQSVTPKGLSKSHNWNVQNVPSMKLNKSAELSPEGKHELASTGLIGAIGAGTSALAHRVMSSGAVKNTTSRAAAIGGGLGLVGDYIAVKAMKKLPSGNAEVDKVKTMNKVASILLEQAQSIRSSSPELVAVQLLKQAGLSDEDARMEVLQSSMEKSAAAELSYSGIDMETATQMVKAANINVRDLSNVSLVSEEELLAETLEKAAAYIEAQHERIAELEKTAGEIREVVRVVEAPVEPALPESITKMAGVGALTFDDIEALKAVPSDTLTKVANVIDQPWEFGKAAGQQRDTSDPLLNFLMG